MSNLIINWRFWGLFFQVARANVWWWTTDWLSPVRVSWVPGRRPTVSIYQGRGWFGLLLLLIAGLVWWAL